MANSWIQASYLLAISPRCHPTYVLFKPPTIPEVMGKISEIKKLQLLSGIIFFSKKKQDGTQQAGNGSSGCCTYGSTYVTGIRKIFSTWFWKKIAMKFLELWVSAIWVLEFFIVVGSKFCFPVLVSPFQSGQRRKTSRPDCVIKISRISIVFPQKKTKKSRRRL